jgi:hypothetical protein
MMSRKLSAGLIIPNLFGLRAIEVVSTNSRITFLWGFAKTAGLA